MSNFYTILATVPSGTIVKLGRKGDTPQDAIDSIPWDFTTPLAWAHGVTAPWCWPSVDQESRQQVINDWIDAGRAIRHIDGKYVGALIPSVGEAPKTYVKRVKRRTPVTVSDSTAAASTTAGAPVNNTRKVLPAPAGLISFANREAPLPFRDHQLLPLHGTAHMIAWMK